MGQVERAAVAVGVGDVGYPRQKRRKAKAVNRLGGAQRHRAHRAPMERAEKGERSRATRHPAGELERRLDRLGARVGEKDARRRVHRRERRKAFAQQDLLGVVEIGARHVEKARRLVLHRPHHARVAMTGRRDGDPRREVDVAASVDIPHLAARAARHDKGVRARVRRRDRRLVARQPLRGQGTDVTRWRHHSGHLHGTSRSPRPAAIIEPPPTAGTRRKAFLGRMRTGRWAEHPRVESPTGQRVPARR